VSARDTSAEDAALYFLALAIGVASCVARCVAISTVWSWHVEPVLLLPLTPWQAAGVYVLAALFRPYRRVEKAETMTPIVTLGAALGELAGIGLCVLLAWAVSP